MEMWERYYLTRQRKKGIQLQKKGGVLPVQNVRYASYYKGLKCHTDAHHIQDSSFIE